MQCPRCKSTLDASLRFCPSCGLPVEDLVQSLVEQEAKSEEPEVDETLDSKPNVEDEDPYDENTSLRVDDDAHDDDEGQQGPEPSSLQEPVSSAPEVTETGQHTAREQKDLEAEASLAEKTEQSETSNSNIPGLPVDSPSDVAKPTMSPTEDAPEYPAKSTSGTPKSPYLEEADVQGDAGSFVKRHKVPVIAVAIMVISAVVALCVWALRSNYEARMEEERARQYQEAISTTQIVPIEIQISDYDEGRFTPIPLRVSGTSKTGEASDSIVLVRPSKPELELLPGSYKVSLAGCLASLDGVLYRGSIDAFDVSVNEQLEQGLEDGEERVESPKPVFAFVQVAPEQVREDDLNELRAWMEKAKVEKASEYVDAVGARRQEALERIAEEQAAKEEEGLKELEETTQKIQKEIEDRKKKQTTGSQDGQTDQNGTSSQDSDVYDDSYGQYDYDNSYGYDPYGTDPWNYSPYNGQNGY